MSSFWHKVVKKLVDLHEKKEKSRENHRKNKWNPKQNIKRKSCSVKIAQKIHMLIVQCVCSMKT